ncbi:hypothetical protein BIV23_24115 [Streptomyces monashensis]|uniref:Transposase n=1 Tax=Streptomyces monashensis TaxID=1678012 RepID=A0A1S2Q9Q3_9ACTN|nr:hypothetical protein BIV23_24115 [Streptomyces monashensis]
MRATSKNRTGVDVRLQGRMVCQFNGRSWLLSGQLLLGVRRPSKAIWNALRGAFQCMAHRLRLLPVGSGLIRAM